MTLTFTIHKRLASRISARRSNRDGLSQGVLQNADDTAISAISAPDVPAYFPTPDACRVHLKLMKSLAELRATVTGSESGIARTDDVTKPADQSLTKQDQLNHEAKQWDDYVSQANRRFHKWWVCTAPRGEHVESQDMVEGKGGRLMNLESRLDQSDTFAWLPSNLPPLDVLMVLHTFMLNPRCFMKDCVKYRMLPLWKAGLPWDLLDDYIHDSVYNYEASAEAQRKWVKQTGCSWTLSENESTLSDTVDSYFSLDLAAAVHRQCVFIQTMDSLSWLYSPALDLTLQRLLPKYNHFFTIMSEHPDRIAVPTHAVDLAWHTHQLSPASYYKYSIERTNGVFIDHDDKLGAGVLTDAFDFTKSEFAKLTEGSEEYGECLCWHCMTLVSIKKTICNIEPMLAEQVALERIGGKQYQKLEDDYARAAMRAAATGKQEPDRALFLENYRWLYTNAVPMLKTDNALRLARPDDSLTTKKGGKPSERQSHRNEVKKGKGLKGFQADSDAARSGAIGTNVAASSAAM